jgi:hypothetical protein
MLKTETSQTRFNFADIQCKLHQKVFIDFDPKTFQVFCKACENGIENLHLEKYDIN